MSASAHSSSAAEAAVELYTRGLLQLETLWAGAFQRSRPISRQVALRISEVSREGSDLLIGLVVARGDHDSIAEHVLQLAIVTTAVARQAQLDDALCYELALYALLHHLGHDTRGALASAPGFLAQRSLLTLLLSQVPERSNYRQALTAFQMELGDDNAGEPRLELAVQQHPLTAFLTIAHDFVEQLCGSPFTEHPPVPLSEALGVIAQRTSRYPDGLLDALQACFQPAYVGTVVGLSDGRRGLVTRRVETQAGRWQLEILILDGVPTHVTLTPQSVLTIQNVLV